MNEQVLRCPQCRAPLTPSRMARQATCAFCGATVLLDPSAVSTRRFREAHAAWRSGYLDGDAHSPQQAALSGSGGARPPTLTLGGSRFALGERLGTGEVCDVHEALRVRWPTERIVFKRVRGAASPALEAALRHEWSVLEQLQASSAPGAAPLTQRVPRPVAFGLLDDGRPAMAVRWPTGFSPLPELVPTRSQDPDRPFIPP